MNIRTMCRAVLFSAPVFFSTGAWAIVIDDFNEGALNLQANAASPLVQGVSSGPGIVGGEREATAAYYAAGSSALDNLNLRVDFLNQDNFSHSQDAGVAGLSIFVYDGNEGYASSIDYNGLGGVDLTAGNADAFVFDVIFADQSVNDVLDLRIYTSETEFSDFFYSFASPITSLQQVEFAFSSFVTGTGALGGADFTNVNAILLAIDGRFEPALDVRLDSLATNEQPVVPEPATLSLLTLGLTCLGMVPLRRRRSRLRLIDFAMRKLSREPVQADRGWASNSFSFSN